MTPPLISIIVTTFNRPTLLIETIRSLLNQTYQRFEILVIDNYSFPEVGASLEALKDDRIRFIKNENRGIIAVNRNVGILHARGQMLAFCDDDDLWFPTKLAVQLEMFRPDRHIGIGASSLILGGGESHRRSFLLAGGDRGLEDLLKEGAPPLSSLLIPQTGVFFSEEPRFRNVEDFEFQIRLVIQTGKTIGVVEAPLIYYRVHPTNQNRESAHRLNAMHVLKEHKKHISRELFRYALARQYFLAGMTSLRSHDKRATLFLRKAVYFWKGTSVKARGGYVVSLLPVFMWDLSLRVFYGCVNRIYSFSFSREEKE